MDVKHIDSELKLKNRIDHFLARWGYRRNDHLVSPGLYALGNPDRSSPVFVTANYTLSFDALRSALKGIDGYILVINTFGINVWCAAGKGTFGTDELVRRIETVGLGDAVAHKKLILPQLGAPGVNAFEVTRRTGFKVEYGPVRARDLPEYLKAGRATPEMRRVRFPLRDRAVLIPMELVHYTLQSMALAVVGFVLGGWPMALAIFAALLAGTVIFPALMPWLPTKDYSTKGLLLGIVAGLPFAAYQVISHAPAGWKDYVPALAILLIVPPIVAYLALNFTGSTPYPSRTGVRKEMYAYIPPIAAMFAAGSVISIAMAALEFTGVI